MLAESVEVGAVKSGHLLRTSITPNAGMQALCIFVLFCAPTSFWKVSLAHLVMGRTCKDYSDKLLAGD